MADRLREYAGCSLLRADEREAVLAAIPRRARVLEIGTLSGTSAAYFAARRPNATFLSVDIFVKGPTVNPPAESGSPGVYGIEHLAFHTDDIEGSVADLKAKGVKFDLDVSPTLLPNIRHAFLRGPDNMLIELLERK